MQALIDHFFTVFLVLLVLVAGAIAKGAIDRIEKNIQAEEGLRDAKPAQAKAPWYSGDCLEVARVCRTQKRMEQVKGART